MKNKGDLTRVERFEIRILLDKGYTIRSIAKSMDRGKSTISYEIKHNSVKEVYDPIKAHNKARLRKRMRRLQYSKIEYYPSLKKFIIEKLRKGWSPDEIAGYLRPRKRECGWFVSKTAIYDWLRTSRGERYCKYLYNNSSVIG
ncbi:MAG: helix-turn-helix domain-containing protein [Candidatus Paceibacterota bacterium]